MIFNLLAFSNVFEAIFGVIIAILVLLLTITVHEFGHYIVGKILKFKINEFAIGMGPAIFKKTKKNGEVFSIRLFPLGGFCAFEGEDDAGAPGKEKQPEVYSEYQQQTENTTPQLSENAFNNKKPWQRILVLIAGGLTNIIFATLIIALNFTFYGHFSLTPGEIAPSLVVVEQAYSLEGGDKIIEVDGKYIYLTTDLIDALNGKKKGDIVSVKVENGGSVSVKQVALRADVTASGMTDYFGCFDALGVATTLSVATEEGSQFLDSASLLGLADGTRFYSLTDLYGYLSTKSEGDTVTFLIDKNGETDTMQIVLGEGFDDINVEYESIKEQNVAFKNFFKIKSFYLSYDIATENTRLGFFEGLLRAPVYGVKTMLITFKSLGGLFNGSVKLSDVSGPVGTISLTSQYVTLGFNYVLEIMALIGISIGIFNLLPIPALDGGRVVFVLIEWIRKKPVNRKVEGVIHFVGLIVLLAFAILVDLLKLF